MKKCVFILVVVLLANICLPISSQAATVYKLIVNGTYYAITEEQYSDIKYARTDDEVLKIFSSLGVDITVGTIQYTLSVSTNANEMEEGSPFYVVNGTLQRYSGQTAVVTIPNQVKKIGNDAFYGNTSLKILIVPNTVTSISANALYGCTNLRHFVAPAGSAAYKYAKSNNIPVVTNRTVKVKDKSLSLLKGDVETPFVFNYLGKLSWNSTNARVVKSVGSGKIRAIGKGNARISAYVGGKKLTIKIKVSNRSEDTRVEQVIKKVIKKGMTTTEKVRAIHNWLIANVKYDYYNYLRGTVPSISHKAKGALLRGIAVCDGYSYAFKEFMVKLGIKCRVMIGQAEGGGHAWNLVKVGGKWKHIDVTFDDPIVNGSNRNKKPYYTYFLKSTTQMSKTHSW